MALLFATKITHTKKKWISMALGTLKPDPFFFVPRQSDGL